MRSKERGGDWARGREGDWETKRKGEEEKILLRYLLRKTSEVEESYGGHSENRRKSGER